jgi:hypothetical protein
MGKPIRRITVVPIHEPIKETPEYRPALPVTPSPSPLKEPIKVPETTPS